MNTIIPSFTVCPVISGFGLSTCSKACLRFVHQLEEGLGESENRYVRRAVRPRGQMRRRGGFLGGLRGRRRALLVYRRHPIHGFRCGPEYAAHYAETSVRGDGHPHAGPGGLHHRTGSLRCSEKPHDCPAFARNADARTLAGLLWFSARGPCAPITPTGRHVDWWSSKLASED